MEPVLLRRCRLSCRPLRLRHGRRGRGRPVQLLLRRGGCGQERRVLLVRPGPVRVNVSLLPRLPGFLWVPLPVRCVNNKQRNNCLLCFLRVYAFSLQIQPLPPPPPSGRTIALLRLRRRRRWREKKEVLSVREIISLDHVDFRAAYG